jgi:hypothetical protein
MKNTLRIFLVVIILMPQIDSYAQTFAIKGGLNLSDMLIKDNDQTYNSTMIPGIHLGASVGIPLSGELLFFEPGILFNMIGSKATEGGYSETLSLNYIDMPLNLKAVFGSGNIKGYGTFGPYIGAGLSGKDKWSSVSGNDSGSEDIKWGNNADNDLLKRFDYGIGIGAGVIFGNVSAGISYNLGIANIASDTSYGTTFKNKFLQISIGYLFGKK